jgi:hypothetical protein
LGRNLAKINDLKFDFLFRLRKFKMIFKANFKRCFLKIDFVVKNLIRNLHTIIKIFKRVKQALRLA